MATVYIATVLENLYKSVLFVTITNKFVFVNVICSTCTGPMIHLKCCILVLSAHAQHQWLALPCSYCLTRRVPFSVSGSLRYRELITSSEYKERSDRRTDVFETYFSSFWSKPIIFKHLHLLFSIATLSSFCQTAQSRTLHQSITSKSVCLTSDMFVSAFIRLFFTLIQRSVKQLVHTHAQVTSWTKLPNQHWFMTKYAMNKHKSGQEWWWWPFPGSRPIFCSMPNLLLLQPQIEYSRISSRSRWVYKKPLIPSWENSSEKVWKLIRYRTVSIITPCVHRGHQDWVQTKVFLCLQLLLHLLHPWPQICGKLHYLWTDRLCQP